MKGNARHRWLDESEKNSRKKSSARVRNKFNFRKWHLFWMFTDFFSTLHCVRFFMFCSQRSLVLRYFQQRAPHLLALILCGLKCMSMSCCRTREWKLPPFYQASSSMSSWVAADALCVRLSRLSCDYITEALNNSTPQCVVKKSFLRKKKNSTYLKVMKYWRIFLRIFHLFRLNLLNVFPEISAERKINVTSNEKNEK